MHIGLLWHSCQNCHFLCSNKHLSGVLFCLSLSVFFSVLGHNTLTPSHTQAHKSTITIKNFMALLKLIIKRKRVKSNCGLMSLSRSPRYCFYVVTEDTFITLFAMSKILIFRYEASKVCLG